MARKNEENFGELYREGLRETAQHPEKLREMQKELAELEREIKEGKSEKKEPGAETKKEGEELETQREKVTAAFEKEAKPSLEEHTPGALGEIEKGLKEKIKEGRTLSGEKLPAEEVQRLTRDFYLKELGYSIQYKSQQSNWLGRKIKDLFWSKATVLDKEGKPILDKKGKGVEFKTAWIPKGETPLISFLKQEFLEKTKKDLEKEQGEKETMESSKEGVREEEKKEEVKPEEKWKGINFRKMEAEGTFEKMREMNIGRNAGDIIESVKKYWPEVSLPTYIEKLLKQYDQQKPEQFRFEKMKSNPKSLKGWLARFLTDIRYDERVKKLREIKLEVEEKKETEEEVYEEPKEDKPEAEGVKETHAVESILTDEQLEERVRNLIENLDKGKNKILLDSPPFLRAYLCVVVGLDKKEVNSMKPEELIKKAKEFLGVGAKEKAEQTMQSKRISLSEEAELLGEELEEEVERSPKKKEKSVNEGEKKLDWLEHARKLIKNGSFNLGITKELTKFFLDRDRSKKEIDEMKKNPGAAWEEAFKIYDEEKRESEKV